MQLNNAPIKHARCLPSPTCVIKHETGFNIRTNSFNNIVSVVIDIKQYGTVIFAYRLENISVHNKYLRNQIVKYERRETQYIHTLYTRVSRSCSISILFKKYVARYATSIFLKVLVYGIKSNFEFKGLRKLPAKESYYSFVAACKFKVENSEERSTKLWLS